MNKCLDYLYHNKNSRRDSPGSKWLFKERQKVLSIVFRVSRIANNRKDVKYSLAGLVLSHKAGFVQS